MRANKRNIGIFLVFLALWIVVGYAVAPFMPSAIWLILSFAMGMIMTTVFPWTEYK